MHTDGHALLYEENFWDGIRQQKIRVERIKKEMVDWNKAWPVKNITKPLIFFTCCSRPDPFWLAALLILLRLGAYFSWLCRRSSLAISHLGNH